MDEICDQPSVQKLDLDGTCLPTIQIFTPCHHKLLNAEKNTPHVAGRSLEDVTARLGSDSAALLPYLTPSVNLTCFADAALNLTAEAGEAGELSRNFSLSAAAALAAASAECALPTVPYIPRDLDDAFTVFVIAVLGCGQQYCLIAAIKVRITLY